MDLRPIGVFDSGVGGLSVLDALVKALPNERFVYVGDTAHMPYGERSPQDITRLVHGIESYLLQAHQAKMLVVACNTSAGILADYWQNACPVSVIEPVIPITDALVQECRYKKIGLLATQATISSGRYQTGLARQADIQVMPVIYTGFAKLVEDHEVETKQGRALLRAFLEPLAAQEADAIILGCTHYPFAIAVLQEIWDQLTDKKPVAWLNPAQWMADVAANKLAGSAALADIAQNGGIQLFVTGNAQSFDATVLQLNLAHMPKQPATELTLPGLMVG